MKHRDQEFSPWLLSALLLTAFLPATLHAQTPATVAGTVRAQGGQPVNGVEVRFAPGPVATRTDTNGRFRLALPAGSAGTVSFRRDGFAPARVRIGPLGADRTRDIAITLDPLYQLDALTVVAEKERPLLNTENATTGGAIERAELEALPTDARDPLTLGFTIPGVAQSTGFFGDAPPLSINGQNSLYTQYTLDGLDNNEGFLGGPRVEFPLAALSRFTVLANTYGASFGRSSNGVVDMQTRAGGNRWDGEAFAYTRPGRPLDAIPFGVSQEAFENADFHRNQFGGAAGGPIVRDRTFVFGALEYTNERENRIASTALTDFTGSEDRQTYKGFARLDHGWSQSQTSTLRFAISDVSRAGQGGGVVVPEADITTRRIGTITALTHRSALRGGEASNTASLQLGTFRYFFPPTRSDFDTPQVTIVGPDSVTVQAVVGSSNFIFDETEVQLQARDVFETRVGDAHTLRFGGDIVRSSFQLDGAQTSPRGAYTVINDGNITPSGDLLSIGDIPADARVLGYTIDANPQEVDLTQSLYGLFAEDEWRVSPSLTLNLGVRWDYDDITSRGESDPDLDNFQPRGSFNWYATPKSVVRGGAGIYTGKFPYAVFSDAVQFGPQGNASVTFSGTEAPAFLEGPTPEQLRQRAEALPPREVRRTFALGLEQPQSYQFTLGYQRQFGEAWGFSVDGVLTETRNLPRSLDLNAVTRPIGPGDTVNLACTARVCPGDDFRPQDPAVTGFRRLTTTEAGGEARYLGLYTQVRRRVTRDLALEGNWVWSRSQNDTEDINFNASQANCFSRDRVDAVTGAECNSDEWADAINDRRHKVSLRGLYTLGERVRVAAVADYQTGTPVNRVAFFRDLDGSGPIFGNGFVGNNDRFFGVDRNEERLPNEFRTDLSAAYLLPLPGERLELRADVFNVFNSNIASGFANGIPGGGPRTQVGRPGDPTVFSVAAPPRQVQISARYVF